jgi:dTDP-4-dehydrorhamnose reductase
MIWLMGNRGMLGTELSLLLEGEGLPRLGTDRELSILDPEALRVFASDKKIDWIVNCAAYTAVDRAEDEIELCTALNVEGPRNLAKLAKEIGASLLHISTDYVFHGTATRPYLEDDEVGPTGVYGRTKAEGEKALLENCPRSVIVRTAWLYGKHGPNFVTTMLRLMGEKEEIGVVGDQQGTPTWARDLSRALLTIVTSPRPRYGIYHFTNEGVTTWHEFATEIQRLAMERGILKRACRIKKLTTAEYPTKARRPAYSVLSKKKIAAEYKLVIPEWKTSLASYITEIEAERPSS